MDRNFDAHADIHRDAQKIYVQKVSADGIDLPIFHDGGLLFAVHGHLEQGVVSGSRAQNLANLFGIHSERYGGVFSAIQRSWNFSCHALAARFILAAGFAECCFDYDLVCHDLVSLLIFLFVRAVRTCNSKSNFQKIR